MFSLLISLDIIQGPPLVACSNSLVSRMKMIFASVLQCVIHMKSLTELINNLERLSGRLVMNVQQCFDVIVVEEPSTKIEKY